MRLISAKMLPLKIRVVARSRKLSRLFQLTIVIWILQIHFAHVSSIHETQFNGKVSNQKNDGDNDDIIAYKITRTHYYGSPSRSLSEIFTEYYSNRQGRARLETRRSQSIFDQSNPDSILVQRKPQSKFENPEIDCRQNSLSLYLQQLSPNPRYLRQLLYYKFADKQFDKFNHVIGLTKLIYIIQSYANAIIQNNTDSTGCSWLLRLENVIKDGPDFVPIELQLEYCNLDVNQKISPSLNLAAAIPRKISFINRISPSRDNDFVVQYYPMLSELQIESKIENFDKRSIDLFAYPLNANCSQYFSKIDFDLEKKGSQIAGSFRRINFQAISYHEFILNSRQWVAFDKDLGAMRIEDITNERDTISILDFEQKKQFIAREKSTKAAQNIINMDCYAGGLLSQDKNDNRTTKYLTQLLFGASKFAYMGEAIIRGTRVAIYEGSGEIYPIWLSRLTLVQTWLGAKIRYDSQPFRTSRNNTRLDLRDLRLSVIMYFAKGSQNVSVDTLGPLLQYEIKDLNSKRVHKDLHQVQIFHWNTNDAYGSSPSGVRSSELYAMPQCFTKWPLISNVNLVLETMNDDPTNDLDYDKLMQQFYRETNKRDNALLNILALKFSPSFAMFDQLETRVARRYPTTTATTNDGSATNSYLLDVNFKYLQFVPRQTQLEFLGAGYIGSSINRRTTFEWYSQTPAECIFKFNYYSKGETNFLFYQDLQKRCLIDRRLKSKHDLESGKFAFKFSAVGMGEIFNMHQERDINMESAANQSRLFFNLMSDPTKRIDMEFGNKTIGFRVKQASWKQAPSDNIYSDTSQQNANNIELTLNWLGFDLDLNQADSSLDGDRQVWEPDYSVNGKDRSKVPSLEQCESACSSNVKCETYSFCIFPYECILSSVSLGNDDANITRAIDIQLADDSIRRLADNSRFSIKLPNKQELKLVRSRHCSLHRKSIASMFTHDIVTTVWTSPKLIKRVDNIEQCARQCFNHSLTVLFDMNSIQNQMLAHLNESSVYAGENWSDEFLELRAKMQRGATSICHKFFYVDDSFNLEESKKIASALGDENNSTSEFGGFCINDQSINEYGNIKLNLRTSLETFKLDLDKLYERKTNVFMQNRLSAEELEAFASANIGLNITQHASTLIRSAVLAKRNFQIQRGFDLENCVSKCLIQYGSVWPWCQSFDIKMIRLIVNGKQTERVLCYLNTMTMDSPDVANLTSSELNSSLIYHHYEPRFKIIKVARQETRESDPNQKKWDYMYALCVIAGILTGLLVTFNLKSSILTLFGTNDGTIRHYQDLVEEPDT